MGDHAVDAAGDAIEFSDHFFNDMTPEEQDAYLEGSDPPEDSFTRGEDHFYQNILPTWIERGMRKPMLVTRSAVTSPAKPAVANARPAVTNPNAVILPTEYREPSSDLNQYAIMIHGDKKVGKTLLANRGGRTLFLQCDPSQKAYRVLETLINNWAQFLNALKQLEEIAKKGALPYDRVVIDRIDVLYHYAMTSACTKLAIEHPGDEGYGKGWDAVRKTFTDGVDRFLALPCGRWFLCHSAWKEVETREGTKIQKLLPILPKQAEEVVNGKVDAWCAYTYKGTERILIVRGDERTGAGNRMDEEGFEHFVTPSGEKVVEIPMGKSATEGYENLVKAFNNQQTFTHVQVEGGAKPVAVPVRPANVARRPPAVVKK